MSKVHRIVRATELAASADEVWEHATTMAGVNRELWPLARMSFPAEVATLALSAEQIGRPLFRSWICLLGCVPVDYDEITIVEFEPPRRFLERSPMMSQAFWQHERTVEPTQGGCRLTDRVEFTPRMRLLASIYRLSFGLAFALRHRNLRRLFGAATRVAAD